MCRSIRPSSVSLAIRSAAVIAVLSVSASRSAVAEESVEGFGKAAAAAQSRTVKIFGGSIGRNPGYGTGLIVSPNGEILTSQGSYLAVENLRVILPDGGEHTARVIRRSNNLQAALLKIEAETPAFFNLNEHPAVENGDWILGVSNAFKVADGAEPLSVNLGVVSLRTKLDARRGFSDFPYEGDVYLLDAITSNPGAAGGAVINLDGKLVGMIGRVIEGKTTNTRLNYAVPTDLLADFLAGKEPEHAQPLASSQKGELGIRLFSLGGRKSPAYVDRVAPGSPAAAVGVKSDDLIVSLAGQVVANGGDFLRVTESLRAGEEVVLEVKRKDRLHTFRVIPAAKDASPSP